MIGALSRRAGVSRLVILVGAYAFKFPHPGGWRRLLWGLLANMQESELGRMGWPELCPVLWSIPGGWLVVMPRAKSLTDDTMMTAEAHAELLSRAGAAGRCVPAENKPDSWGGSPMAVSLRSTSAKTR